MAAAVLHDVGYFELVRNEVSVGGANVGTVKPNVSLLGYAGKVEPPPPSRLEGSHLEAVSVKHGPLVGQSRRVGPVTRNAYLGPASVIEFGFVKRSAEFFASGGSAPEAGQVHSQDGSPPRLGRDETAV